MLLKNLTFLFFVSFLFIGCGKNNQIGPTLQVGKYSPKIFIKNEKPILIVLMAQNRLKVKEGKSKSFIYHTHGDFGELSDWNLTRNYFYYDNGPGSYSLTSLLMEKIAFSSLESLPNARIITFDSLPTIPEIKGLLSKNKSEKVLIININEWYLNENFWSMPPTLEFRTNVDLKIYNGNAELIFNENLIDKRNVYHKFAPVPTILTAYEARLVDILNYSKLEKILRD